jgi:hypothetical protein
MVEMKVGTMVAMKVVALDGMTVIPTVDNLVEKLVFSKVDSMECE